MHDYKFRGKKILDGQWVYGSLLQSEIAANGNVSCAIVERFAHCYDIGRYEVEPGTVGQYTGLKDKNGKEIYECDMLKRTQSIDGNFVSKIYETYEVAYNSSIAGFEYKPVDGKEYKQYTVRPFGGEEIEIIGNIHEQNAAHATEGNLNMNTNFDPGTKQEEVQPAEAVKETETEVEQLPDQETEG